jgi:LPXTG-motif cell wall-anchored protein
VPDGNPVDDPEVETAVLPPAGDTSTPVTTPTNENAGTGTPAATPADATVTGTWEQRSTELPQTGANSAGIGVAGLLLIGLGYGVRRAARSGR